MGFLEQTEPNWDCLAQRDTLSFFACDQQVPHVATRNVHDHHLSPLRGEMAVIGGAVIGVIALIRSIIQFCDRCDRIGDS